MKIFFLIFAFAIIFYPQNVNSQIVKYSNDFLQIGGFSSEQAMAGSNFSSISGADAGFSNPARMFSGDYKVDFSYMHCNYFQSMANFDMAAAVIDTDSLTALGLTFLRFGVDDIQNTIYLFDSQGNINYDNISYFSAADYALIFSLSRRVKSFPGLSLGANIKLIYRMEGSFAKAYGFGFDIAASWQKRKFSASAVLKDVSTTFNFWSVNPSKFDSVYLSTGNSVPENKLEQTAPSLNIGASYYWNFYRFKLLTSAALQTFFDGERNMLLHSEFASADLKLGLELSYFDLFFLRFGLSDFQHNNRFTLSDKTTVNPSFGAGVSFFRFRFDYAFFASKSAGLNSNMFTLGIRLGAERH
jgi:hypothetical protein